MCCRAAGGMAGGMERFRIGSQKTVSTSVRANAPRSVAITAMPVPARADSEPRAALAGGRQVWSVVSSRDVKLQGSRFSVAMADSRTAISFGGRAAEGVAMGQASACSSSFAE